MTLKRAKKSFPSTNRDRSVRIFSVTLENSPFWTKSPLTSSGGTYSIRVDFHTFHTVLRAKLMTLSVGIYATKVARFAFFRRRSYAAPKDSR